MSAFASLDIFKKGSDSEVDVVKAVCLLWNSREESTVVERVSEALCSAVAKGSAAPETVSDVEYYLPQLCHLVIHLKVAWESQALERVAFTVAQTSMHTALQLAFYLRAAMEDYQPEFGSELPNPASNPELFYRCARLLQNVQRAVVYCGGSQKVDESSVKAILSANKLNGLVDTADKDASIRKGYLLFKRNTRKSAFSSKPWKPRYFRIEQQVLFCLRSEKDTVALRAMHLLGSTIALSPPGSKYPHSFEVINSTNTMRFCLRAEDAKTYKTWTDALKAEKGGYDLSLPATVAVPDGGSVALPTGPDSIDSLFEKLTATQRKRAHFFRQQVAFTDALTGICEGLRGVEKPNRKFFLTRDLKDLAVAPFSYVPMCSSLDPYSYILRTLPDECHAFTTKARVPALMMFEVEEHPKKVDVMTFLAKELQEYSDSELDFAGSAGKVVPSSDGTSTTEEPTSGASRIRSAVDASASRAQVESLALVSVGPSSCAAAPAPIVSTSETLPEPYGGKLERLKGQSPFNHIGTWSLRGLIAKSNDDVRQEVFVMQLIAFYQRAFTKAKLPLWLYTYTILSTSKSTVLIHLIPDAFSIDSIKKRGDFPGSLRLYYEQLYGAPVGGVDPHGLTVALGEFVKSMAAYSIVCYLLQIKDRHNGNIMIDNQGHIIHIDFGFVFGLAPGKAFSMELRCPWKLNKEMVAVMGGLQSQHYAEYVRLCVEGLLCARNCYADVVALMEILTHKSNFPAFRYNPSAIDDFKARLLLDVPDNKIEKEVQALLFKSYDNRGSDYYDDFQKLTNGILP
jgi:phosphatidylinositol 4-kinase